MPPAAGSGSVVVFATSPPLWRTHPTWSEPSCGAPGWRVISLRTSRMPSSTSRPWPRRSTSPWPPSCRAPQRYQCRRGAGRGGQASSSASLSHLTWSDICAVGWIAGVCLYYKVRECVACKESCGVLDLSSLRAFGRRALRPSWTAGFPGTLAAEQHTAASGAHPPRTRSCTTRGARQWFDWHVRGSSWALLPVWIGSRTSSYLAAGRTLSSRSERSASTPHSWPPMRCATDGRRRQMVLGSKQ